LGSHKRTKIDQMKTALVLLIVCVARMCQSWLDRVSGSRMWIACVDRVCGSGFVLYVLCRLRKVWVRKGKKGENSKRDIPNHLPNLATTSELISNLRCDLM
jgi:hypothetical protein